MLVEIPVIFEPPTVSLIEIGCAPLLTRAVRSTLWPLLFIDKLPPVINDALAVQLLAILMKVLPELTFMISAPDKLLSVLFPFRLNVALFS